MSLTTVYLKALSGEAVTFKPQGSSMKGLVESGSLVKVKPCLTENLEVSDIVLVKVKGSIYLHKIVGIKENRFLIGNNRGGINGWTQASKIAGLCVEVNGVTRPRLTGKLV